MSKIINSLLDSIAEQIVKRVELKIFSIGKAQIEPGDILIVQTKSVLSDQAGARLEATLKRAIPQVHRVVIIDDGFKMGILRAEPVFPIND